MKIYIVFDDDQDGITLFHVASSMEKADQWIKDYYKRHGKRTYFLEVKEVEVDGDYLNSI